jgi:2-keto-3-deoxy-L-rhamnonate aldolase RhmA
MNRNAVKRRLAEGGIAVGTYVAEFYTAGLGGIVAAAGADFVIFDYEHSGWATESLRTQIALARGAGLVPIVNSPGERYEREGVLLDMGAQGLMVPHVAAADQACAIVAATRYAPAGHRGGAFGMAHDGFRMDDVRGTIADANDSILIVAKLESRLAIENAEAILTIPGIDVALVTAFDLSLDLGVPGEVAHPAIIEAMERVKRLCLDLGKTAGCAVFDPASARRRVAEGYRFIQYSWDIGLLQEGLRAGVAALRAT